MAKVISSDVSSANSDNISNIETISMKATQTAMEIGSFNSDTVSTLVGGGYDAVRIKLSLYQEILEVFGKVGLNLINNLKSANNGMINYMEGYTELDDSKLSEIESRLNQINATINYLNSCSSSSNESGIDYSAAISYWQSLYKIFEHYRDLLKNLSSTDGSLYSSILNVIEDVSNAARASSGVNESTFTTEGMNAFKNGTGSIYKYDSSLFKLTVSIDTSNMSDNAKKVLEAITGSLTNDLDDKRLLAVQTALSLLDKGITYSQSNRHGKDASGNPTQMDCSSFVTYCLRSAGYDVAAGAYTGTYLSKESNFTEINSSELKPGDVALKNRSTSGGSSNHIGIFVGYDSSGQSVWLECSGGGIKVSYGTSNWGVFKTYTAY